MSGIDLDRFLVETAQKVTTSVDANGDIQYGSTAPVACLYRDISSLSHNQNRNDVLIDGLLWFKADQAVEKKDVFYHADEGYLQITRIVKAKRLVADNTRQFIKCEVIKQRQIS